MRIGGTARAAPRPVRTHQEVFRRTAARVGAVGAALVALGLLAGMLTGGRAWNGAVWGGGAGALLTLITVAGLTAPWDRFPLLASSGIMLSFLGKIAVMVAVVLLAGPRRDVVPGHAGRRARRGHRRRDRLPGLRTLFYGRTPGGRRVG